MAHMLNVMMYDSQCMAHMFLLDFLLDHTRLLLHVKGLTT